LRKRSRGYDDSQVKENTELFRNVQAQELLIVLLIILLIFGARKLPDLARSLGASAKEFRKGVSEGSKDDEAEDQAAAASDVSTTETAAPAASDVSTTEAAAPEKPPTDTQNPG
jgi:sec-independent protein translocase protein TatA